MKSRPRIAAVIGVLFLLIAAFAPLDAWGQRLFGQEIGPNYSREILWWVLTLGVYAYVLVVERRALSSIGLHRPRLLDIGLALLTAALLVVGFVPIELFIFPVLHLHMNMHVYDMIKDSPLPYRVLLVTRAAVAEETIFRGYSIERLQQWSGSRWLAGAVTWALFTYAHLQTWGVAQLIVAGYGGLLLTVLYLWRRNLWANMLTHWLADAAGFLL